MRSARYRCSQRTSRGVTPQPFSGGLRHECRTRKSLTVSLFEPPKVLRPAPKMRKSQLSLALKSRAERTWGWSRRRGLRRRVFRCRERPGRKNCVAVAPPDSFRSQNEGSSTPRAHARFVPFVAQHAQHQRRLPRPRHHRPPSSPVVRAAAPGRRRSARANCSVNVLSSSSTRSSGVTSWSRWVSVKVSRAVCLRPTGRSTGCAGEW